MGSVLSFFRPAQQANGDWSQQELAEFYRVEAALTQSGLRVTTDRGVSDEDDPWFVFCRFDGEVILHFARIGGEYFIVSEAFERPMRGPDFRTLLNSVAADHPTLMPIPRANAGDRGTSNLVLHPAALLAAIVATVAFQLAGGDAMAGELATDGASHGAGSALADALTGHAATGLQEGSHAATGREDHRAERETHLQAAEDNARNAQHALILSAMTLASAALPIEHSVRVHVPDLADGGTGSGAHAHKAASIASAEADFPAESGHAHHLDGQRLRASAADVTSTAQALIPGASASAGFVQPGVNPSGVILSRSGMDGINPVMAETLGLATRGAQEIVSFHPTEPAAAVAVLGGQAAARAGTVAAVSERIAASPSGPDSAATGHGSTAIQAAAAAGAPSAASAASPGVSAPSGTGASSAVAGTDAGGGASLTSAQATLSSTAALGASALGLLASTAATPQPSASAASTPGSAVAPTAVTSSPFAAPSSSATTPSSPVATSPSIASATSSKTASGATIDTDTGSVGSSSATPSAMAAALATAGGNLDVHAASLAQPTSVGSGSTLAALSAVDHTTSTSMSTRTAITSLVGGGLVLDHPAVNTSSTSGTSGVAVVAATTGSASADHSATPVTMTTGAAVGTAPDHPAAVTPAGVTVTTGSASSDHSAAPSTAATADRTTASTAVSVTLATAVTSSVATDHSATPVTATSGTAADHPATGSAATDHPAAPMTAATGTAAATDHLATGTAVSVTVAATDHPATPATAATGTAAGTATDHSATGTAVSVTVAAAVTGSAATDHTTAPATTGIAAGTATDHPATGTAVGITVATAVTGSAATDHSTATASTVVIGSTGSAAHGAAASPGVASVTNAPVLDDQARALIARFLDTTTQVRTVITDNSFVLIDTDASHQASSDFGSRTWSIGPDLEIRLIGLSTDLHLTHG